MSGFVPQPGYDWEHQRIAAEKAAATGKPFTLNGIKLDALCTLHELMSVGDHKGRLEAAKAIIAYFARVDGEHATE